MHSNFQWSHGPCGQGAYIHLKLMLQSALWEERGFSVTLSCPVSQIKGLYNKPLLKSNLRKIDRFRSKLVYFSIARFNISSKKNYYRVRTL